MTSDSWNALFRRLEPAVTHVLDPVDLKMAGEISIAISLRRIADALDEMSIDYKKDRRRV